MLGGANLLVRIRQVGLSLFFAQEVPKFRFAFRAEGIQISTQILRISRIFDESLHQNDQNLLKTHEFWP